jgi:hypothetical protein
MAVIITLELSRAMSALCQKQTLALQQWIEMMGLRDGLFQRELLLRIADAGEDLARRFDFILNIREQCVDPLCSPSRNHSGHRRASTAIANQRIRSPEQRMRVAENGVT